MAHIVDSVLTARKKEHPIALDAGPTRVIRSGVTANFMLVLELMKLSTVDYAENFHVISSSTNMIQNTDRRAHS